MRLNNKLCAQPKKPLKIKMLTTNMDINIAIPVYDTELVSVIHFF